MSDTTPQAKEFFSRLYGGQTGVLELRTVPRSNDEKDVRLANKLREFIPVRAGDLDHERVHHFIEQTTKHKLAGYFGVALRTNSSMRDRKGDEAHCQSLTALFVDVDFKHANEDVARQKIDSFPLPPTLLVHSGGGLHPYWLLKTPILLQVGSGMRTAKSYLRRLAKSVADIVDVSVSEPVRVLRVPGSYNFKPHYPEPKLVVLERVLDAEYSLEDFDRILGEEQEPEPGDTQQFEVPENIGQGDRHEILYKLLRSQKARGLSLEVALATCHALNERQCNPPIERKELDEYLRRVWNQEDSPTFKAQQEAVKGFILDAEGKRILPKNQHNVKLALHKLGVKFSFNTFSQRPLVEWHNFKGMYQDPQRNRIWLEIDRQFHFQIPDQFFDIVTSDLAQRSPFHPVREYLDSVEGKWDGVGRVNRWLIDYASAADTEFVQAVSAIVLIAAVRRVRQPGCKFDEMLVLESNQGLQKSSALRALCPDGGWFGDDLPLNVDAKQIIERTSGKWIIEAPELSGMHASKVEHLKAMLSREVDGPVRMAYGHLPSEQPRQFIIIGTTNSHQYLDDSTGNRRFWPVRIEKFDVERIRRERDQIWAEAALREREGESIRLPEFLWQHAEFQQERRRSDDPWENILRTELDEPYLRVPPSRIWQALGIPTDRQDQRSYKRIVNIMQRLGFKRQAVRDESRGNKVVMGWSRGKKLIEGDASAPADEHAEDHASDE